MDTGFFEMFKMMEAMNVQNGGKSIMNDESFENMMQVLELKNAIDNCECYVDVLCVAKDFMPPESQRDINRLLKFMELKEVIEDIREF